jgi:hypothetical protein
MANKVSHLENVKPNGASSPSIFVSEEPEEPARESVFADLKEHLLDQDDTEPVTEELLVTVPIRKPSKKDFVRAHKSHRFVALVWEDEDTGMHYIHPNVRQAFLEAEGYRKVLLALMCTRRGTLFFWPVTTSQQGDWQRSAIKALETAEEQWVKIIADMELRAYRLLKAIADYGDPDWKEYSLEELLEIAFRGRVIRDLDNKIARDALGR